MPKIRRVEQILIRKGSKYKDLYKFFDRICFLSKNLYNSITYNMRQDLIANNFKFDKIPSFFDKRAEYCALPDGSKVFGQQTAEQIVKITMESWISFKKISLEFEKDPEKFCLKRGWSTEKLGELRKDGTPICQPRMPKYLDKEKGRYVVSFRGNRGFKRVENKYICSISTINNIFKEVTGKEKFEFKSYKAEQFGSKAELKQVRIVPRTDAYMLELVFEIEVENLYEENKYKKKEEREKEALEDTVPTRLVSIKTGFNYFATVGNNFGEKTYCLMAEPFRPIILEYSKEKARLQSIAKELNGLNTTKRIGRLGNKFTRHTKYLCNCYSKYIVDWCIKNNVDTVILGKSKGLKQGVTGGNNNINNLLPIAIFEDQLKYKFESAEIRVIEVSTAYTARTSFLDLEPITKSESNKHTVKDGKITSSNGITIDSNVNAVYQLIRKRYNKAFDENTVKNVDLDPDYYVLEQSDVVKINKKEITKLKVSQEAINANYISEMIKNR